MADSVLRDKAKDYAFVYTNAMLVSDYTKQKKSGNKNRLLIE